MLGVHRDGGMTELLSLPVAEPGPRRGLSADACATVEFLAIGAHAVRRSGDCRADRALVIGAGPIGLGVGALRRDRRGQRHGDGPRPRAARGCPRHHRRVAPSKPTKRRLTRSPPLTDGEGFDVVFDATGNASSMERGFDFVAHGGRYVLVSVVKGPITFEDPDFHRREMTLLGSRNATAADFEHVIAAIRAGRVPLDRLITHRTIARGRRQRSRTMGD